MARKTGGRSGGYSLHGLQDYFDLFAPHPSDSLSFYWDEEQFFPDANHPLRPDYHVLRYNDNPFLAFQGSTVSVPFASHSAVMSDRPMNPNYANLPTGYTSFRTLLVGVKDPVNTGVITRSSRFTILNQFTWNSNFAGTGGTVYDIRFSNISQPLVGGSGGIFGLRYSSTDELTSAEKDLLIQIGVDGLTAGPKEDKDAPTTTPMLSGNVTANGVYLDAVTIRLIATDVDGPDDVAYTMYSIDNGVAQLYVDAFTVATPGNHTLTCYSVDRAGNVESPPSTVAFTIVSADSTPPTVQWGMPSPGSNSAGWNNTAVDLPFAVTDERSGVAYQSLPSPLHFASEGKNQTQSVAVRDNAGNSASYSSPPVNIDLTAPTITASPDREPNAFGWYSSDVKITFYANDNLSGIASVTDPIRLTSEGAANTAIGEALDRAGNRAAISVGPVKIDKTAPRIYATTSPSILWPPDGKLVPVLVAGTFVDGLSGVDEDSLVYSVQDEYGAIQPSGKVTVASDGTFRLQISLEASRQGTDLDGRTYTVIITGRDRAGNKAVTSAIITVPHDHGN